MVIADREHTAIVLGLFDTGAGVIRSLGRHGVSVIGIDVDAGMPGFGSRYCRATLAPDPTDEPEALAEFVLGVASQLDAPPVLLPATDAYALFVSRYRDRLAGHCLFRVPPPDVAEATVDKRLMYELAEKVGTPMAASYFPQSIEDVEGLAGSIRYPVFVKPYVGHVWRRVYGATNKGLVISSPDELVARYREILAEGLAAMVQDIIPGPDTNVYEVSIYAAEDGRPVRTFVHRKIHQWPPGFGVASCAESVEPNELVDLSMQFIEGIGYRGQASIEFKLDADTGEWKMLELNPRFSQQHTLALDCGIDFPAISYLDLVGPPPAAPTSYEVGRKWLDPAIDLPSFIRSRRSRGARLVPWVRSWSGTRSFPVFAWDDLGPFLRKWTRLVARLPRWARSEF